MTLASLVCIDHIGNWSRVVLEQCFYDWKLFKGKIKFSCCSKSHSRVAWADSPNRFEPEVFIAMTLKISKPVNEPLNRVFQTVSLLLMKFEQKKLCTMKHTLRPIQDQTYDASQVCCLFTARNSTDTAKKPDKYICQRGTGRVFVTSGFVSANQQIFCWEVVFPPLGNRMERKNLLYKSVLMKYPIIINLY